jgi:predicted N-acetyltransferase YhbS
MMARAFVTNPLHVAAFGHGQLERNEAFFRAALAALQGPTLIASDGDRIVGAIHWIHSSRCQLSPMDKLRMMPGMVHRLGVRSSLRVAVWMSVWARRDPKDPHVHLGPIGVDPSSQGKHIGHVLMQRFCVEVDSGHEGGYLETDRPENVAFYRRFGFEVTGEASGWAFGTTSCGEM